MSLLEKLSDEARGALEEMALDLALTELENEFPNCSQDRHLNDIVAAAIASLVRFGQSDPRKLATYAAARGRAYVTQ